MYNFIVYHTANMMKWSQIGYILWQALDISAYYLS